jgi:hypothetical protein
MSTSELSGSWLYRTLNPTYAPENHFTARNLQVFFAERNELDLIRAEAVLNLRTAVNPTALEGTFEWQEPDPSDPTRAITEGLNLNGTVREGDIRGFEIVGTGRPGTRTDGWEYRYHGYLTPHWPKPRDASAVDQRPTLVGSVFRAKSHNGVPPRSPAGEVFSFIAVKQPPLTWELSGLWTYRSFFNDSAYFWEPGNRVSPINLGELILQEDVFTLETPTSTTLQGTGLGLDLQGRVQPGVGGEPPSFQITGTWRPAAGTAGWEFQYQGHLTRRWPKPPNASGVDQRPALVGSVIWAKPQVFPDGSVGAPAGYVAPFIAVKR